MTQWQISGNFDLAPEHAALFPAIRTLIFDIDPLRIKILVKTRFGKFMRNRKEIWSLKGVRTNRQSYLLQTFCPIGTDKMGCIRRLFNRKVRQEVAKIARRRLSVT